MGWGNKREGAQMDDGYARARESRRTAAFVVWECVVLVVGFTVSIRIAGVAQVVVAVLGAAIVLFFAIIMIRTPNPSVLTPLSPSGHEGTWRALAPATLFPELAVE
jgi:hypothetical protein